MAGAPVAAPSPPSLVNARSSAHSHAPRRSAWPGRPDREASEREPRILALRTAPGVAPTARCLGDTRSAPPPSLLNPPLAAAQPDPTRLFEPRRDRAQPAREPGKGCKGSGGSGWVGWFGGAGATFSLGHESREPGLASLPGGFRRQSDGGGRG